MKKLLNNGQLGHKNSLKSILFSGLIGFNFLIVNDGYGANNNNPLLAIEPNQALLNFPDMGIQDPAQKEKEVILIQALIDKIAVPEFYSINKGNNVQIDNLYRNVIDLITGEKNGGALSSATMLENGIKTIHVICYSQELSEDKLEGLSYREKLEKKLNNLLESSDNITEEDKNNILSLFNTINLPSDEELPNIISKQQEAIKESIFVKNFERLTLPAFYNAIKCGAETSLVFCTHDEVEKVKRRDDVSNILIIVNSDLIEVVIDRLIKTADKGVLVGVQRYNTPSGKMYISAPKSVIPRIEEQVFLTITKNSLKDLKHVLETEAQNATDKKKAKIWESFDKLNYSRKDQHKTTKGQYDTMNVKRNWNHVMIGSVITAGAALAYYYYKETLKQYLPWLPF